MSLIQQLGFLEFEVSDLGAWEVFMTKVLGTQLVDKATDGSMRFPHGWPRLPLRGHARTAR
jgi:hypothetical protein